MGAALLQDPELADLCARCEDASGIGLRHLLVDADDEELRLTQNAQPALSFVGIGLARLLARRGIEPAAAAGHSVGEYAALCAAGALEPEAAARVVGERGRAMADAAPAGTTSMAAVLGLDAIAVEAALAGFEDVWPANYNTPTQTVVGGKVAALEAASERLREAGARRVLPLNVSAAFHTPLVAAAAGRLRVVLDGVDWRLPNVSVASNLTGAVHDHAAAIPEALEAQLRSPVRWADCVRTLAAIGCDTFIEVGPRRALTGMMRELVPEAHAMAVATPEECAGLTLPG
jgi:[acyl-carrier-protein] S-malonyltransferase